MIIENDEFFNQGGDVSYGKLSRNLHIYNWELLLKY